MQLVEAVAGEQLARFLRGEPQAQAERSRGREPAFERRSVLPDVGVDRPPAATRMDVRAVGEVEAGVPIELHYLDRGLRPAGPPSAVARGGPNAPLRSGGRAHGALFPYVARRNSTTLSLRCAYQAQP